MVLGRSCAKVIAMPRFKIGRIVPAAEQLTARVIQKLYTETGDEHEQDNDQGQTGGIPCRIRKSGRRKKVIFQGIIRTVIGQKRLIHSRPDKGHCYGKNNKQ